MLSISEFEPFAIQGQMHNLPKFVLIVFARWILLFTHRTEASWYEMCAGKTGANTNGTGCTCICI